MRESKTILFQTTIRSQFRDIKKTDCIDLFPHRTQIYNLCPQTQIMKLFQYQKQKTHFEINRNGFLNKLRKSIMLQLQMEG